MPYVDPVVKQLRQELRVLRRAMVGFSEAEVAGCVAIVAAVGLGSLSVATARIFELSDQFADDTEGDITAYFETAGHGLPGDTLDARLNAYAERHRVDQRTGRRRSDRGIEKIADLLYERSDSFRPGIDVSIAQSGNWARAMLTLRATQGTYKAGLNVEVNGELIEELDPQFHEAEYGSSIPYLEATLDLPPVEFRDPDKDRTAFFDIRISWMLPTWQLRQTAFTLADPRLLGVGMVENDHQVRAQIIWLYPSGHPARVSPFQFAEHPMDEEENWGDEGGRYRPMSEDA